MKISIAALAILLVSFSNPATFAKYLCRGEAAVLAALQQPWSNGPVEGNICAG
jgi:transposase